MSKILDSIDQFLDSQKESEAKVFFFLPVLLFGFLSYYFIYPVTDGNLTNTIQEKKRLSDDIQKTKQSNNSLKISISTTNSQIKTGNKVIESLTYSKEELEQLVKQLTFLRFDL